MGVVCMAGRRSVLVLPRRRLLHALGVGLSALVLAAAGPLTARRPHGHTLTTAYWQTHWPGPERA